MYQQIAGTDATVYTSFKAVKRITTEKAEYKKCLLSMYCTG